MARCFTGAFILATFLGVVHLQTPRLLGKISAKHAGFLSLFETEKGSNGTRSKFTLLVASFDAVPFSKDSVFGVADVGSYLSNLPGATVQTLTEKVTWPNDVSGVPANVMGPNLVVIPDGFLVPFKKKGSLSIINITNSQVQGPYKISDEGGKEWFYHKVIWKDMDNDGLMDAVTCRASDKSFGQFDGELVWFKNPGAPFFQSTWKANVITDGPDVYLTPARLPASQSNFDALLIPGYFVRRLSVYWIENNGTWTNPDTVKSRVIEDTFEVGGFFDVQYVDVNGDGKKDLLATSSNAKNGSVIVYELPDDFRTGVYKKHVLASKFKAKGLTPGKGSPGSAQVFSPSTNSSGRPYILLSGDDDGKAYILKPTSSDPSNWDYSMTSIVEAKSGPVGSFAIGDVDGDGFTELFIPIYEAGEIQVFTYKAS